MSSNGNISALLAFCAGNSPVTGEFPTQRPVTRSFDVFFDHGPNEWLSKQWRRWWFKKPTRSLWRHCNVRALLLLLSVGQSFRLSHLWFRVFVLLTLKTCFHITSITIWVKCLCISFVIWVLFVYAMISSDYFLDLQKLGHTDAGECVVSSFDLVSRRIIGTWDAAHCLWAYDMNIVKTHVAHTLKW